MLEFVFSLEAKVAEAISYVNVPAFCLRLRLRLLYRQSEEELLVGPG